MNKSLEAGRRLRRRNRAAIVAAVIVAVIAVAIPAAYASRGSTTRHRPPAVHRVLWPVAYIAAGSKIVPVQTKSSTAEKAIRVPSDTAFEIAVGPDGKGYVDGSLADKSGVIPVNLLDKTAGRSIDIDGKPGQLVITPSGQTVYVLRKFRAIVPVDVADNHAGKAIQMPMTLYEMAISPNGQTLYAVGVNHANVEIVPVRTATNKALKPIFLSDPGEPVQVLVTPNGKTLVVLEGYSKGSLNQISVATGKLLTPVRIKAAGVVRAAVLSPNGQTAYVLSSQAVTPVDLATNTAGPTIKLPKGTGYGYNLAMAPNGNRVYVLTEKTEVVPISTTSGKALAPIAVRGLDYPTAIAVNPNSRVLYVGSGTSVAAISTATGHVTSLIPLGGTGFNTRPWAFAFLP